MSNAEKAWVNEMHAGKRNFQRGDLAAAARAFSRATQMQPNRVEGWINLGSSLLQGKQFADAEEALKTAAAINPKLAATHMLTGDAQRLQGRMDAALSSYRLAVDCERSPVALNKLACALRSRREREEAAALYREAIKLGPDLTIARVNMATLEVENENFSAAAEQLKALSALQLPEAERIEVRGAELALAERERLYGAIERLAHTGDKEALVELLGGLPKSVRQVDGSALTTVNHYLKRAPTFAKSLKSAPVEKLQALPEDWPLIEGAFMIPLVNSAKEYVDFKHQVDATETPTGEMAESVNMAPAIEAARGCRDGMKSAAHAEANLRHWHSLTGKGLAQYHGGHFKYTQNWVARTPYLQRVAPHLASATFQHFIRQVYSQLPPGLIRAAVSFLAVCDLHPFADGNGRVLLIWLNRELEWAGQMPALFQRSLGLKGDLAQAMRIARTQEGELQPLLSVIQRGQVYASTFLQELDELRATT